MAKNAKILICEDDEKILTLTELILGKKAGHEVHTAQSGEECLEMLNSTFSLVLLDIQLPGISGLEVLKEIKKKRPELPVIIMTAFSTESLVIKCLRDGAHNYLKKPFEIDYLVSSVDEAISSYEHFRNAEKSTATHLKVNLPTSFKSSSHKMKIIEQQIIKLAGKKVSVLLTGESGTGKEYYAKELYRHGNRSNKPFVDINCPAIPENLFESELFGHEKGAFTGADSMKLGKFEQANEGVIFLDEIADLDANAQSKLLRVLQERNIVRLGGSETISVDIQLISATSRILKNMIASEEFRSDLFYRICDVEIEIPPLRDRLEDLSDLVDFFATEYAQDNNEIKRRFDEETIDYLMTYNWPGNIRELKSTIRRLLILNDAEVITLNEIKGDLNKHFLQEQREVVEQTESNQALSTTPTNSTMNVDENEKALIESALEKYEFNLTKAAKAMGMARSTIYRKIKKYKIKT